MSRWIRSAAEAIRGASSAASVGIDQNTERLGTPGLAGWLAALVFIAGLASQRFFVIWVGFFIVALILLAEQMSRLTSRHLRVSHRFEHLAGEIGEPFRAELVIENPLPWPVGEISWELEVSEALAFQSPADSATASVGAYRRMVRGAVTLSRQERVRVPYSLTGDRRGRFPLGPSVVSFRDPTNWSRWVRRNLLTERLTVWPRRFTLPASFFQSHPELGERGGRIWDPTDPLRIAGIRPYRPGDPIRRVHPYASARTGQLMVKEDEHVVALEAEVILHPETSSKGWAGTDRRRLEDAISLAATVVEGSLARGLAVGLSTSGMLAGHRHGLGQPPSRAPETLPRLFTALAWMEPSGNMTANLLVHLAEIRSRARRQALIFIVAPVWPAEADQALAPLVSQGARVIWITNGPDGGAPPYGTQTVWRWQEGSWQRG